MKVHEISVTAYIALGSNLGHNDDGPAEQITRALLALHDLPQTRLVRQSSLYKSPPDGYTEQPDFINAVAELRTHLGPQALLRELLKIELRFGRQRLFRNAPRTLDLDLLLHGEHCLHEPGLTLPHPRMHSRPFVLIPLLEIAPHLAIPGYGALRALIHPQHRDQVHSIHPNTERRDVSTQAA
jgi:2-amino-4-hydroxy-6-hydroxymethyldihydropteridine diphosphokinase